MSLTLHGPWTTMYGHWQRYDIEVYVTNLIDKRGNILPDGAFKIEHDGKKVKMFKGETAWSDAERYANDLATKIRYS